MKRCYAKNDKDQDIEFVKKTDGVMPSVFCRREIRGDEEVLFSYINMIFLPK